MSYVSVIFTRKRRFGSIVLRAWMHSRFSHCALVDEGTLTVIEAVPHGIQERPLSELVQESSYHEVVRIHCRNPQQVLAVARGQVGKPYDWKAILGFWLRRSWQKDDAFICSELVAWCFATAGQSLFRREPYRVSPEMLYLPLFDRS